MLHYVCHNNDVIIDGKSFWYLFLLFSWREKRNLHTKCSYFKVSLLVLNPYYCERLLLEYMQTRVYCNLYMATRTHTGISVNAAAVEFTLSRSLLCEKLTVIFSCTEVLLFDNK